MKSIELNTAVADNGGQRRDAGDHVGIGKGDRQVDPDRAKHLVDTHQAVAVAETVAGGGEGKGTK